MDDDYGANQAMEAVYGLFSLSGFAALAAVLILSLILSDRFRKPWVSCFPAAALPALAGFLYAWRGLLRSLLGMD